MYQNTKKQSVILALICTLGQTCYAENPVSSLTENDEALKSKQILMKTVIGNTFTGTIFDNGHVNNQFEEYHAHDGRVLGYNMNRKYKNRNSCWQITSDNKVCYYYSDPESMIQDTCWNYEIHEDGSITGKSPEKPYLTIQIQVKKGNPDNLNNFGYQWKCNRQTIAFYKKPKPH